MRHPPRSNYSGLTIVLQHPSRADKINLLSAGGGRLMDDFLKPEYSRFQCDIRTADERQPLIDGTKAILLLGEGSAEKWLNNKDNTLNEIRGSIYQYNNICAIPSYFPQDATDIKDYEGQFNEANIGYENEEDSETTSDEKSRHNKTQRKNYRFWLQADINKCKRIIRNSGSIPHRTFEPNYIIYPSSEEVITLLQNTKDEHFYIDIETDCNWNILCFSFSFSSTRKGDIFVVPVLLHDYGWAYDSLHYIFRALSHAIRNNCTVAHNGAQFDFMVFVLKYRMPISRNVYDTMIAQHRCYPEVEKSLGHCTSLWTYEPFHKDEGSGGYMSQQTARKMWAYCGKDVFTMILIHQAQMEHATRIPGLRASIEQAMQSIRPYMILTMQGLLYNNEVKRNTIRKNDRLMMHYLKWIELLIGPWAFNELNRKSIKGMPGSNTKCVQYFHDMLGYPIMNRSKKTDKPSLGKKSMFKLRLQFDNPVIDLCIAYRELAKESGSLKFNDWTWRSTKQLRFSEQETIQQLPLNNEPKEIVNFTELIK